MTTENRLSWFRDARFGMFIHWGIYCQLGFGEWVQFTLRIPVKRYEILARSFNPVRFDADAWAMAAKNAGMRYMIITAKHHDGFSMFETAVDSFNVVQAAPWKHDPMKDLADACRRHGLKFGFYYSHVREWRHPKASSWEHGSNYGNSWDYPDESTKDLNWYIDNFDKPQLRELLTNYGPIGVIWFDTPSEISEEKSRELTDLVHELQPDCLVNGRVGNGLGDYESLGDDEIPVNSPGTDWETPMTICRGWGYYDKSDNEWKEPALLIRQLVSAASRGGNYLLNVGPTPEGKIPPEALERLAAVGSWMDTNEESIRGATATPFSREYPWGTTTFAHGKLYLHLFDYPIGRVELWGIKAAVRKAQLLSYLGTDLPVSVIDEGGIGGIAVYLPSACPDPVDTVVVLEIDGAVERDGPVAEQQDGSVWLHAFDGKVSKGAKSLIVSSAGITEGWTDAGDTLAWDFAVRSPGDFEVSIVTKTNFWGEWDFGHVVTVSCADQALTASIEDSGGHGRHRAYEERITPCGSLRFDAAGVYSLSIEPEKLVSENDKGLQLRAVALRRSQP